MNMIPYLTDTDRSLLDKRIAEFEKQTKAQIVLASVKRSDSYTEIPWKAFALGASLASLLTILFNIFILGWLTETMIFLALAVIPGSGILLALLAVVFPRFGSLFLSTHRQETETLQYAESLFLSRELFSTEGRRGILILVSQFERQIVILPDTGVRKMLSEELLKDLISNMSKDLRRNKLRKAMEKGLDGIEKALVSPAADWTGKNELSDQIIEEEGV